MFLTALEHPPHGSVRQIRAGAWSFHASSSMACRSNSMTTFEAVAMRAASAAGPSDRSIIARAPAAAAATPDPNGGCGAR